MMIHLKIIASAFYEIYNRIKKLKILEVHKTISLETRRRLIKDTAISYTKAGLGIGNWGIHQYGSTFIKRNPFLFHLVS